MISARPRPSRRPRRLVLIAGAALALVVTGTLVAPQILRDAGEDDRAVLASAPVTNRMWQVAGGGEHSCGISYKELYCWGRNTWGQTGNGGRGPAVDQPVKVGRKGWRQVAAGGATTCAIRGTNRWLKCWGLNHRGQLGDGTTTWTSRPVTLASHRKHWKMVDVGWYHTCAVRKTNNRLFCWGDNSHGQLGLGDRKDRKAPTRLPGRWRKVATEGWTTCAIAMDRSLHCWGRNIVGQVGDGTRRDRSSPVQVASPNWKRVDVSWTHACGIRRNGTTWCWGGNDHGQLGDGTTERRTRPTRISARLTGRRISTGENGTCLTTKWHSLFCWGDDTYQQVGGPEGDYTRPQRLTGRYRNVTSGWLHNCGVRRYGGVDCWGNDERAQVRVATNQDVQRVALTDDPESAEPSVETVAHANTAAPTLRFRLATYNVLGENHTGPYRHEDGFAPSRLRSEWTMQTIRTHELDIVGLQEPAAGQVAGILKAGDGRYNAYPHPTKDNKSTETTIVWDTQRFAAVQKRTIRTQFIAREYPRPYIKFKDRQTGRKFWVMNIHNAPWDYQRKRNEAVAEQLAKINELEASGLPVYYIGDFNEKRTILCKVLRNTDMKSPLGGWLSPDGTCNNPNRGRMRVDWIFGSKKHTEWSNYRVVKYPMIRLVTDHWVHFVDVAVP